MSTLAHIGGVVVGYATQQGVDVGGQIELPQTKDDFVKLGSAILVQAIIFGISKLFKWISKKNETPIVEPAPSAPQS